MSTAGSAPSGNVASQGSVEGASNVEGSYTIGSGVMAGGGAGESVIPRTVYTDDFHDTIKDTLRASPEYEAQKMEMGLERVPSPSGTSEASFVESAGQGPILNAPASETNPGILGKVKEKVLGVTA